MTTINEASDNENKMDDIEDQKGTKKQSEPSSSKLKCIIAAGILIVIAVLVWIISMFVQPTDPSITYSIRTLPGYSEIKRYNMSAYIVNVLDPWYEEQIQARNYTNGKVLSCKFNKGHYVQEPTEYTVLIGKAMLMTMAWPLGMGHLVIVMMA